MRDSIAAWFVALFAAVVFVAVAVLAVSAFASAMAVGGATLIAAAIAMFFIGVAEVFIFLTMVTAVVAWVIKGETR